MTKKKYVKPVLETEEFVPQEYIAACQYQVIIHPTGGAGVAYIDVTNDKVKQFHNYPVVDGKKYIRMGNVNGTWYGNTFEAARECAGAQEEQMIPAVLCLGGGVGDGDSNPYYDSNLDTPVDGYILNSIQPGNDAICFYAKPGQGGSSTSIKNLS